MGNTIAGPNCASDNGSGVAIITGPFGITLTSTPATFAVFTNSYYDFYPNGGCEAGGTCLLVIRTSASAMLGKPTINSLSTPYVFVGTNGTLTLNDANFVDPFGNPTSIQTSRSGGTGFSVTTGSVGYTQATANYSAALTATTGLWNLGISYFLGNTDLVFTYGNFTVGDCPGGNREGSIRSFTARLRPRSRNTRGVSGDTAVVPPGRVRGWR